MKRFTALSILTVCTTWVSANAEYAIQTRTSENIGYLGSRRVYVQSPFSWPHREPKGLYTRTASAQATPVYEYDHPVVTCDAATDICTAANHNLPNGTEVKFGTSGTLPAPIKSWDQDHWIVYYVRDSTTNTFKLAATSGGAAMDITTAGTGTHSMSFAGYSHAITVLAWKAQPYTIDAATDILTFAQPHGYTEGRAMFVINEGGTVPSPLVRWYDSRPQKYCAITINSTQIKLRFGRADSNCAQVPGGQESVTVTCDASTDKCTYPASWAIETGTKVRLSSTGTLPGGVTAGVIYHATALIDGTTTNTFELEPYVNGPNVDITSTGVGTLTATAVVEDITGAGTGIQYASFSSGASTFIYDITGYPPGTIFTFRSSGTLAGKPGISSRKFGSVLGSSGRGTFLAKVPHSTPPGDYPITVTLAETMGTTPGTSASAVWTNFKSLTYTLKAETLTPLSKTGPGSYPAIPGLSRWELLMTSSTQGGGGASGPAYPRCPNRTDPTAGTGPLSYTSIETKVWFYDGAANFYEISRHPFSTMLPPGDQLLWANCGEYVAAELRDKYLSLASRPSWAYMPKGLYLAYGPTQDPRYKQALIAISKSTAWDGSNDQFDIRPHAFAFERKWWVQQLTGVTDNDLPYYVDTALGMLRSLANDDADRTFAETFMVGLMARPLIEYYRTYHDERIPVAIKAIADKIYTEWYDPSPSSPNTHRAIYNPEPVGERCTASCQVWTDSLTNNLISPMYAWLWRLTGDDTDRVRGDTIFQQTWEGTAQPFYPKQWSQGYYWAFDFWRWRTGRMPGILTRPSTPATRRGFAEPAAAAGVSVYIHVQ